MRNRLWTAVITVAAVTVGSYFGGGLSMAIVGAVTSAVAVALVFLLLPSRQAD